MTTKTVTYSHIGGRPATFGDARRTRIRGRAMVARGVVHALDAGVPHGCFSADKQRTDYEQRKYTAVCGEEVLSLYSDGCEDFVSPVCEAVGSGGAGVSCKKCLKILGA